MAEQTPSTPDQPGIVFRSEALRRLRSSDQLTERIVLIPPAMRMMVASLTVIIAAGLIWGMFGSVPTRVVGHGVLLADGRAAHSVQPIVAGPIIELLVKRGDTVDVDTDVARVQQVALQTQFESLETRLAVLRTDLEQFKKANELELRQIDIMLQRQKAVAEEQITAGQVRAKGLHDILTADESLFNRGIISRLELAQARADHDRTLLDIANARARSIEIEELADTKRGNLAELERQKQEHIDALQAEASRLKVEVSLGSLVKAPVAGRIEEIRVGQGDVVAPGTIIATIGRVVPEAFEVLAVFDNNMAKRIAPGMDVHVHPASVRKEEHGAMRARVLSISELGISKAELNAILRNPQLTDVLMGTSSPLLAKVEVFLDRQTPSGFAWWGGRGPPYSVTRGTRVTVDVIVERQAPIALVIPAMRHLLGLEG
ncbi:MAG TPA: NHLP bacteriocin system secretion protein [Hyphomicrobiaceae bacterium]